MTIKMSPTDPTLRLLTFLAPNMRPLYEHIARHLEARLDRPVELADGRSFDQFGQGQADAGFICGAPYVRLRWQDPPCVEALAAPVLAGERYAGRPIYFSDVVVHRDSPYHSFADLRGRSWAYNDRDSHSGWSVTLYRLAQLGAREGYFGRVVESGFHQKSLRLVAAGQVDASAIDSQVLAVEQRDHAELAADLRVIDALGPSTIQPFVAAAHLTDSLKAELQAALLELDQEPAGRAALAHGFVERFVAVSDSSYDDIRQMIHFATAAGITYIR
jgi:phosphonate transport system substrate-binding protein